MALNERAKAPDYTNSAENLCNPPEVGEALSLLHRYQDTLEELKGKIPAQLQNEIKEAEEGIRVVAERIKDAIEQYGSYQDIEAGDYAVKYRRMHKDYHVEPFKKHYPEYIPAVVTETINVKALEGLIKGGLLNEADLKHISVGVITETPQFAFVIR